MEVSNSRVKEFQKYVENHLSTHIYPHPNDEFIKTKSRKPAKSMDQNGQEIILHAQPSEGTLQNILNAFDGRKRVENPSKWPNSVHGVITAKFEGIEWPFFGTGTLIGPNIVLTAGHNLYSHTKKAYAQLESIQFLPGIDIQMLPFGIAEVEKYYVSPNYVKEKIEDYGILILKEPVGEMTGYFGLICPKLEELTQKIITVTGYPRDKVKEKPHIYEMWGMEGPAAYIDQQKGLIQYPIDTAAGQSGSGVWYQDGEDYYVCGIHQGGNSTFNQATLLTRNIYQQIYAWLQEIPTQKFLRVLRPTEFKFYDFSLDSECLEFLMTEIFSDLRILSFKLHPEEVIKLGQNSSWVNLSSLDLYGNEIGDYGAVALAQNTSWINLSQLNLKGNLISCEGATALAQNTSWINLSHLNLYGNGIFCQGAIALARTSSWFNLSNLNLSSNMIGRQGGKALARNVSWINLSHLDLSSNLLDDEGAVALGQNVSWINLSHLNLSQNRISSQGATGLAQNVSWINLSHLDLSLNLIDDEGAVALGQNVSWMNLSHLDLMENSIGYQGAIALAQNTSWINLSHLNLKENLIGCEGARGLAKNTSWVNLSHLDLSGNQIGDEGVTTLAQNISWAILSHLNLKENLIGYEGATALAQNTSWFNLSYLNLSSCSLDTEGAVALGQNVSWINLSHLNLSQNMIRSQGAVGLAQNTSWVNLLSLDLSSNLIGAEGAVALGHNTSWINIVQLDLRRNNIFNHKKNCLKSLMSQPFRLVLLWEQDW